MPQVYVEAASRRLLTFERPNLTRAAGGKVTAAAATVLATAYGDVQGEVEGSRVEDGRTSTTESVTITNSHVAYVEDRVAGGVKEKDQVRDSKDDMVYEIVHVEEFNATWPQVFLLRRARDVN